MNAEKIARSLKLHGLSIKKVQQGSHDVDGMVGVTALVHVQVPTYGRSINVVSQSADGKSFWFYQERKASDIAGIVADIREACGIVA